MTRIDYLIVWSLSRWSRNVQDHHRTRELVKQAGARIVSITEPMIGGEDTPESFYMEGLFALNNQYDSMKTGRNVSNGILQKAKEAGAYGPAKLGYINSNELLPDGRKVACIDFDPEVRLLRLQLDEGGEISSNAFRKERERLDQEIAAAKKSLAATEEQMSFDATLLRMALELADDVSQASEGLA